jgi:hypothetical protein
LLGKQGPYILKKSLGDLLILLVLMLTLDEFVLFCLRLFIDFETVSLDRQEATGNREIKKSKMKNILIWFLSIFIINIRKVMYGEARFNFLMNCLCISYIL